MWINVNICEQYKNWELKSVFIILSKLCFTRCIEYQINLMTKNKSESNINIKLNVYK